MKQLLRKSYSWIKCIAVPAMLVWTTMAPLAAHAEPKPIAVVSLAGYDALISDLDFLGELSGTPQLSQSIEGIVALVTRAQGLVGLDKSKPIGAAVMLGPAGLPTPLVFVPVTDADKLLDALQGLVPTVEDLGDGFSRLKPASGPSVVMKEGDGWAFLSTSQDNLVDLPADPSKLLGDLAKKYDAAIQINVQNIPEQFVQLAVQQLRIGAAEGLKQLPNEDDDAYRVRKEFAESYLDQVTQLIEELDHVTVGFAIELKSRNSYLDVMVTVKDGGKLSAQLAASAKHAGKSQFAGLADPKAVANLHFTAPIMPDDEKALLDMVSTVRQEATKKIDKDGKLDDAAAKQAVQEMVSQLFDVVEATIRGGKLNGGAVMLGKGPFEFVVGGLVVDAMKLDAVVKRAVELFGQAAEFPAVKFNAAEHDGVTFHTITFPAPDDDVAAVLGETITVALGFGADRVLLGAGADPLKSTAGVLDKSKKGGALPPGQLQLRVGPLVKLSAEQEPENRELADTLGRLLEGNDKDHFSVKSDFIPNGTRVRLEIEEGVIEAFAKAVVLGMQRGR